MMMECILYREINNTDVCGVILLPKKHVETINVHYYREVVDRSVKLSLESKVFYSRKEK